MLIYKIMLRAAGVSLAAIISLAVQPAIAQTSSESDRLQKLERAVEQLQQRNAELEAEVKSLKKQAVVAAVPGESRTVVTSDGKKYVEKSVPFAGSVDKWKLSTPIKEIELYGDARVRYEYRGGRLPSNDPDHPSDWLERHRERYRVRLGLRGKLTDDWFFGLRLETSTNPRSTNVTFGDDSQVNGPFSKENDRISVGQAYLGYKGFPDLTLTAGRFAIPFVNTSLVWDDDINVEGLAQQWKHTFVIGGGAAAPSSYSKDGKTLVESKPSEPLMKIDVFANFGQFVYDDTNPENPIGPQPNNVPDTEAFMLGWQVGARFDFPEKVYFQLAPTLYNYTGHGDSFFTHFSGDPGGNQTGINSLLVFDMPVEIGWKIGKLPMRVFGDFAVNLDADDRAFAAGHPDKDDQRYAYLIGLGLGQLKAKNDWEIRGWWQHSEQFSLDPNLVDSDIYDSRLNLEGVAVKAGYALADAIVFNLTWAYGWRIDDTLGTGGTGDIGINPLGQYQLFQADLSVKF